MATFGANYNPQNVMFGRPGMERSGPYVWNGPGKKPPTPGAPIFGKPPMAGGGAPFSNAPGGAPPNYPPMPTGPDTGGGPAPTGAAPSGPTGTLGPRTIRATGTGPFDPQYRQNLASYAGGQFSGNLNFNPTDVSTFPGLPTGGGNAPVTGMPPSLLDTALAGQGFSWAPPQPAQTATPPPQYNDMQFWLDQFMRGGRGQRQGSFL